MEKQNLTYDEYRKQVVDLAFEKLTREAPSWWKGKICMDTIPGSYREDRPVEDAAITAENDTCYWDGGFGV